MEGHDERGRFTAGNKGGGRKKMPREFHDLLINNAEAALNTIIEIMNDDDAKPELRLKAATYILDSAYGSAFKTCQSKDALQESEERKEAWRQENPEKAYRDTFEDLLKADGAPAYL